MLDWWRHGNDMVYGLGTAMQKTLRGAVRCTGIGVHSGQKISMTLLPAKADTGVLFRRTDLPAPNEILASWRNAVESPLCTMLTNGAGLSVGTIEHLMAAFAGSGVDNVIVEIDGPEVPIMDGSAAPFLFLIECAGTVTQDATRRAIRVLKPITVCDGDKSVSLAPDHVFSVSFEIDFAVKAIAHQETSYVLDQATFKQEISRARTFGLLEEVAQLQKLGLARGGSLENAVVVSGDRVLNEDGLRFSDEFVRHKILDVVGDLYLAGAPILGHFTGVKSSHALNRRLVAALFANPDSWCWTTLASSAPETAFAPASAWGETRVAA